MMVEWWAYMNHWMRGYVKIREYFLHSHAVIYPGNSESVTQETAKPERYRKSKQPPKAFMGRASTAAAECFVAAETARALMSSLENLNYIANGFSKLEASAITATRKSRASHVLATEKQAAAATTSVSLKESYKLPWPLAESLRVRGRSQSQLFISVLPRVRSLIITTKQSAAGKKN